MTILFPTISSAIQDINNRGIYPDLIRKFASEGHEVYVISPIDRKKKLLKRSKGNAHQLGVPFFRISKASLIERLWSMWRIASVFERAIEKNWPGVQFDLILYATPPITFNKLIANLKKKHQAKTYLMLKDIFPQNAVDLGMINPNGLTYSLLKKQEEKLYLISDRIGCMSKANLDYLHRNSIADLSPKTLICPNAIDIKNKPFTSNEKRRVRYEFELPQNKVLIIYGGNLGKPQGLHFLKQILNYFADDKDIHFVICGAGTESESLDNFISTKGFSNVTFFKGLGRSKYDRLEACADIALVFLDARFTIPNYPSRILSYMEHALPILFSIDLTTDVGKDAELNGYGVSTLHGDLDEFHEALNKLLKSIELRIEMGNKGRKYLQNHFTVEKAYQAITNNLNF